MRRIRHAGAAVVIPALGLGTWSAAQDICHQQSPVGMAEVLQGAASCEVVGASTVISLAGNTEIAWNNLSLPAGHELQFVFRDPADTVVNRSLGEVFDGLGRQRSTVIGGRLSSNGNVVVLSPNNWLQMRPTARVETAGFTASGLDADAGQFLAGASELVFSEASGTNPTTRIRGEIVTTDGDVVMVGKGLEVTADIDAAGSVVAVSGGGEVRVTPRAPLESSASAGSQIIQGGSIRARNEIAFISQQAISLTGRLEAGNGRGKVYARVDDGGVIRIGDAGLEIKGKARFSVTPEGEVAFIGQDEGDSPAARAPAVNEIPSLSRSRRTTKTRPTGAVIASRTRSGLAKDEEESSRNRKRQLASSAVTPVRKRSFFRTRATVKGRGE